MSFNPRCPFHTAALTTAVLASFSYAYFYFTSKVKEIKRFDIDSRFTDSIKFNNMVFISGQVGDGETIEEQTISALNYVDVALSKVFVLAALLMCHMFCHHFDFLVLIFFDRSSKCYCHNHERLVQINLEFLS